ncbi:MAG: oligosaccharide flippase family protein [Ktedonobacteraceae bacterium]
MRTLLFQWAKTHSAILVNTGSLAGTTVITFVLGFPYWWLAARQFPPEAVGLASAAISAMTLLASIAILGWGTLLIGEIPRQPGKEIPLLNAALILVGGIGGCLGIVFAVVAPFISAEFQALGASAGDIALFAVGVSLTAIATVLEGALIGLWRSDLILWRSALFAVAKLVALFAVSQWLSHRWGLTIYATWTAGNTLSLAALAGYAVLKGRGFKRSYLPHWGLLRKLGLVALQHHILNWILGIPVLVAPMLITTMLSAQVNAWYYIAGSIASLASVIPTALVFVGYTAGCAEPGELARKMRLTLSLAFVTAVLANGVLQLGARQTLSLFGQSYAEQALWSLRIFAVGAFPLIIKNHYIVLYRIWGRVAYAILPITAGVVLELAAIVLGALLGGLLGLSLCWIAAIYIEAACMFRTVYRTAQFAGGEEPPEKQSL